MDMKQKLIEIVADYKEVDPAEINPKATFKELGLDSLDVAELALKIEDELEVVLELSPQYNSIEKMAAHLEKQ